MPADRVHRTSPDPAERAPLPVRRRWLTLLLGVIAAAVAMTVFAGAEVPPRGSGAPGDAESARVAELRESFPDADVESLVLVATREDGGRLEGGDLRGLAEMAAQLPAADGQQALEPRPSEDGEAAILQLPVRAPADASDGVEVVDSVRGAVADHRPAGTEVQVTGGPAIGADIASSFDGANLRLLLATVSVVALLLLLTYRSPVLWLIPLTVVGFADQVAARVTAAVGEAAGLSFEAGVVSVLVFGAGTNYALLLISRYREELRRRDTGGDHRLALGRAWRATLPAILASNLTVVLSVAILLLASVPSTRGLGLATGVGLLIALVAVLTLLPAALAVVGRRVFWPFVPRPGDDAKVQTSPWERVARGVIGRPATVAAAGALVLAVLSTGLLGTRVGLPQTEQLRVEAESVAGLEVLAEHFPAGDASPMTVLAPPAAVEEVQEAAKGVDGVRAVRPGPVADTPDGERAVLVVTGDTVPGSAAERDLVGEVRAAVHDAGGGDAQVGGPPALAVDEREAQMSDLVLVVPLVLLVVGGVLLVLLRSVVAPLVLLTVNALSAVAAIGAGTFLGRTVLGWEALDTPVPLLAFIFLVALGIDYTIFLVHRARSEVAEHGSQEGIVRAVGATGAVITSAGIVLAAVFAALGVLPFVTLGQIGLIVGIGVLVDTLLVRTMVVPAIMTLLGERFWWPGRPAAGRDAGATMAP